MHGFKSFTANISKSQIKFLDLYVPESELKRTERVYAGKMSFAYGNWFEYSKSFEATEQVTSDFCVTSCDGYWSTVIVCETGSSSYGPAFTIYGNSNTAGCIKRYWWFTDIKIPHVIGPLEHKSLWEVMQKVISTSRTLINRGHKVLRISFDIKRKMKEVDSSRFGR